MRHVEPGVEILLLEVSSVDAHAAVVNFYRIARQADDAFDVTLRRIVGEPEDDDVAAFNLWRPAILVVIDELVDEDALAVVQARQHPRAFHFHRLHDENYQSP